MLRIILLLSLLSSFPLTGMMRRGHFPSGTYSFPTRTPHFTSANINEQDENGRTPLHRAVLADNTSDIKVLLSIRASLDIRDNAGFTPVEYANTTPALKQARNLFISLDLITEAGTETGTE